MRGVTLANLRIPGPGLELWAGCADFGDVTWLVALWIALIALWGVSTPRRVTGPLHRLAHGLATRWHAGLQHPFDWAKD